MEVRRLDRAAAVTRDRHYFEVGAREINASRVARHLLCVAIMSKLTGLEAIDLAPLARVTGGQDVNDYGDLSGLVPHSGEKRNMTPEQRLNRFLYGGAMSKGDRTSLIKNWEENNGRQAPSRIDGTPDIDW